MNGKGRGPEKGYNRQAYAENYDAIFRTNQRKEPMKTPEQEQPNQPTVLPWHREAAKDCCNFGDHWNKGPGATLPNGSYGDNIAAIIARHDPHANSDLAAVYSAGLDAEMDHAAMQQSAKQEGSK